MSRDRSRLSVSLRVVLALVAPAAAQDAYFSLTGNFVTAGDQHDFFFDLINPVGSGEVLRFETFARNTLSSGFWSLCHGTLGFCV